MNKQLRIVAFLARLPVGYRERAIEYNMLSRKQFKLVQSMEEAIAYGFRWSGTDEGYNFWRDVHNHLRTRMPDTLPPYHLPDSE